MAEKLIIWLARKAGRLTRDVQQAYKEGLSSSTRTEPAPTELLIETAKKIGINIHGKTREQISEEIVRKAKGSDKTA